MSAAYLQIPPQRCHYFLTWLRRELIFPFKLTRDQTHQWCKLGAGLFFSFQLKPVWAAISKIPGPSAVGEGSPACPHRKRDPLKINAGAVPNKCLFEMKYQATAWEGEPAGLENNLLQRNGPLGGLQLPGWCRSEATRRRSVSGDD